MEIESKVGLYRSNVTKQHKYYIIAFAYQLLREEGDECTLTHLRHIYYDYLPNIIFFLYDGPRHSVQANPQMRQQIIDTEIYQFLKKKGIIHSFMHFALVIAVAQSLTAPSLAALSIGCIIISCIITV